MVYPADFLMVEGVGEITAVEPGEAGEKVWDREKIEELLEEKNCLISGTPRNPGSRLPWAVRNDHHSQGPNRWKG